MNQSIRSGSEGKPGSPAYDLFIAALEEKGCRRSGHNWQCPAHDDRIPSLTVKPKDRGNPGVMIWCHAGCPRETVAKSLGLELRDLFDEPFGSNHDDPIRQEIRWLIAHLGEYPWEGRTGRTDRDVMSSLLIRAEWIASYHVAMSWRDVALRSGVSSPTAGRSLHRLGERGCICPGPLPSEPAHAREYAIQARVLRAGVLRNEPHVFTNPSPSCSISGSSRNTLAAGELGVMLGKAGLAVWLALTDEKTGVREIARRAQVSPPTASRALRGKLRNLGLAEPQGQGWVRGEANPDNYDPDSDSFAGPIVAKRRETYQRQHCEYREILEMKRGPGRRVSAGNLALAA